MRVLGVTVARNEVDRYLVSMMLNAVGVVDDHFVYDDRSDDATVDVAASLGGVVAVRSEKVPSFLEHEGRFRQASWAVMELALEPEAGDWILSIDADEALVGDRFLVDQAIKTAEIGAVRISIPEVFEVVDGVPMIRTDGFWLDVSQTRLFPWRPGGEFPDVAMGCGGVPSYVRQLSEHPAPAGLALLHYGYAVEQDRRDKYQRYAGRGGHNPTHVASILAPPSVVAWTGFPVEMRRRGD